MGVIVVGRPVVLEIVEKGWPVRLEGMHLEIAQRKREAAGDFPTATTPAAPTLEASSQTPSYPHTVKPPRRCPLLRRHPSQCIAPIPRLWK